MTDYEKSVQRYRNAVEMRPVDKIPFSYNGPAFTARASGMLMKDYITDFKGAADALVSVISRLPGIDSSQVTVTAPRMLSGSWLSRILLPGEELGDDALWQCQETEVVKYEDYQYILDHGFGEFREMILKERLGDPLSRTTGLPEARKAAAERLRGKGILHLNGGTVSAPFERLCGGRSLMNFFIDLIEEPEYMKKIFDRSMECITQSHEKMLSSSEMFGCWIGGWRGAPEMISHDMWQEFVWPYMKELALITLRHGVVPIFHLDSNWDREFETFLELPPRSCIIALDGRSDMRRARAVLDDRFCLMGDVPAALLAAGTAEEVYDYTHSLIDDVGPKTGLIVSSGCDIPDNAKFENVEAMCAAAAEFL